MTTTTYSVPAIHCSHCTHTIEIELSEMEGVDAVTTDLTQKRVTISYGPPADDEKIRASLPR